jgi:hypothetical protein
MQVRVNDEDGRYMAEHPRSQHFSGQDASFSHTTKETMTSQN